MEQSVRFSVANVGYPSNQIQQILVLPASEEKLILLKVFQGSPLLIGARNEFRNQESRDSLVQSGEPRVNHFVRDLELNKGCERYLQPPATWIKADLESRELLTLLERIYFTFILIYISKP